MTIALFLCVVLLSFLSEAIVGFGSTVLAVTLGAQLYPLDVLLPAFVPVNLLLTTYLVVRHRDAIDVRLLVRRILPFMALGMPLGMFVFQLRDLAILQILFATFVVGIAALELWRVLRAARAVAGSASAVAPQSPRPLSLVAAGGVLFTGGFIHGIYGSGGPMVVFFASREITDKRRFRSTLSALWLVLNAVLVVSYAAQGAITRETAELSAWLLPVLFVGAWLGEHIHGRVKERPFRVAVFALLFLAGSVLLVRGLLKA